MKSIEETAKEYADVFWSGKQQDLQKLSTENFKAGAEFAQRWIPVDEELPPCSGELKLSDAIFIMSSMLRHRYGVGLYDSEFNEWRYNGGIIKVTHWRPINLT